MSKSLPTFSLTTQCTPNPRPRPNPDPSPRSSLWPQSKDKRTNHAKLKRPLINVHRANDHSHRFNQSKLGASATQLNLSSPPPASSSLFRKAFTPNSNPCSLNTSSPSSNQPLINGPFLRPSSSHSLLFPPPSLWSSSATKHTKCRSTLASAAGAAVSPFAAASACAASRAWDS